LFADGKFRNTIFGISGKKTFVHNLKNGRSRAIGKTTAVQNIYKKWQSSFDGNKTAIQGVVHFTPTYEWEGKYKNGRAVLTETKLQYNVWCTLPRYTNGRENMVCFQFNIVKRK
jgi:hypothetical protein